MYSEKSAHLAPDLMFDRLKGMCDECVSEKERKKGRKKSIWGIRTLLAGQVHYHCAIGMPQMVGNGNGYSDS